MLLAGDIGGTKTALGVFSQEAGPRAPHAQQEYPSADYPGLAAIVREFLAAHPLPVTSACFDVAGPVVGGRAKVTNLPWVVDCDEVARELALDPVYLLNDLEALAYAVPALEPEDLRTLNAGEAEPRGPIAVIAPGTGLGEAFLTWGTAGYRAHASEGGHVDFAPADETQLELLRYLLGRYDHVSYERVCAGIGIPNIYDFFRDSGRVAESPEVARRLAAAGDRTPVIVQAALDAAAPDPLCAETFRTFVRILGAEAGNLALTVMATGGVYVGGGIPRRTLGGMRAEDLMTPFLSKGRLSHVMARMPVHVIARPVPLMGAAWYGLTRLLGVEARAS
jgi:glucokinase